MIRRTVLSLVITFLIFVVVFSVACGIHFLSIFLGKDTASLLSLFLVVYIVIYAALFMEDS